jgi:signal transduction histidine kinase
MEVSVKLEKRSDAMIMADPDDMEIVFNNLISNAVKYNRFGGKVDVTIDSSESEAIIMVSDTGIGIEEDDIENLFTEFVRIKSDKTKNITGSGLGLSIVKKVVELYHGSIKVESTPEAGSTFTVRLPKKLITIPG